METLSGARGRALYTADFLTSGWRAARGVVWVAIDPVHPGANKALGTGWLITDRLVVLPDYLLHRDRVRLEAGAEWGCDCRLFADSFGPDGDDASTVVRAAILPAGPEADLNEELAPALARLARPVPDRALELRTDDAAAGALAIVLHHPLGQRNQALSIGRVLDADGDCVMYDAETEAGSSGAPVLDAQFRVVGMHIGAWPDGRSQGVALAAMLRALRGRAEWDEIARHHRLADISAAHEAIKAPAAESRPAEADLLRVAIRWDVDPAALPDDVRDWLRPRVADPDEPRWAMSPDDRERAVRAAGSPDALRAARGSDPIDGPGQAVIDRILLGPPYDLVSVADDDLPYWLQSVRWFAAAFPDLPSPAAVEFEFKRRRVRGRLTAATGQDFRGRDSELRRLRDWYRGPAAGPMVVTGIGGVGKSALVAQFALSLPDDTVLLWLDFDRYDLAPDDPPSVLAALVEQMAVQAPGHAPPHATPADWAAAATAVGDALAGLPRPPLVVLDGFEVAQHVPRHREVWKVLDAIAARAPAVRTIVSGRAAVAGLELGGRKSGPPIELTGLDRPSAEEWLRKQGVTDPAAVDRVVSASNGLPLLLRLAERWLRKGGDPADLDGLKGAFVEGFLYSRILRRVLDPALEPLARAALVVRRLTADMLAAVFAREMPSGAASNDVFERLSRELSLFGDETGRAPLVVAEAGQTLRLRAEVRRAALKLLEQAEPELVRSVDKRAAAWYAGRTQDEASAAELVYHRLRLGDLMAAAFAWQDGCAALLQGAEDELPEGGGAAVEWLRSKLTNQPIDRIAQIWEAEVIQRARDVLGRGHLPGVREALAERSDRQPGSPLVVYDAWAAWNAGDLAGARRLLAAAGPGGGTIGRDRAVLAALLAAEADDPLEADRCLAGLDDEGQWADQSAPADFALAVWAARTRLTVDPVAEREFVELLEDYPASQALLDESYRRGVTPIDWVLSGLTSRKQPRRLFDSFSDPLTIPTEDAELPSFRQRLYLQYSEAILGRTPRPDPHELAAIWAATDHRDAAWMRGPLGGLPEPVQAAVVRLIRSSIRRQVLASSHLFLARACELIDQPPSQMNPLALSIIGTLAAFLRARSAGDLSFRGTPLDALLDAMPKRHQSVLVPPITARRADVARTVLDAEGQHGPGGSTTVTSPPVKSAAIYSSDPMFAAYHARDRARRLYLLGPGPLEMLVRAILGVPDSIPL